MSAKPVTTCDDPRVDSLAAALRDEKDGSTGWINTSFGHKQTLRCKAQRLIRKMDEGYDG